MTLYRMLSHSDIAFIAYLAKYVIFSPHTQSWIYQPSQDTEEMTATTYFGETLGRRLTLIWKDGARRAAECGELEFSNMHSSWSSPRMASMVCMVSSLISAA